MTKPRRGRRSTNERVNGRREASHVPPQSVNLHCPHRKFLPHRWAGQECCRLCGRGFSDAARCTVSLEKDVDVPRSLDGPGDGETPGGSTPTMGGEEHLDLPYPKLQWHLQPSNQLRWSTPTIHTLAETPSFLHAGAALPHLTCFEPLLCLLGGSSHLSQPLPRRRDCRRLADSIQRTLRRTGKMALMMM